MSVTFQISIPVRYAHGGGQLALTTADNWQSGRRQLRSEVAAMKGGLLTPACLIKERRRGRVPVAGGREAIEFHFTPPMARAWKGQAWRAVQPESRCASRSLAHIFQFQTSIAAASRRRRAAAPAAAAVVGGYAASTASR